MKKKFIFCILLIINLFQNSFAQMENDSLRYKEQIFDVEVEKDVVFAHVIGYWDEYPDDSIVVKDLKKFASSKHIEQELDLKMDIYLPKNDSLKHRPLIVFAHGGAFYIGYKAVTAYREWCKYFASLGYVCVSIDYRLGFKSLSRREIEQCEYKAMQDAHAALRFLVANAEKYGIDTENIFVGGSSAGSMIMLGLAYMTNADRFKSTYKGNDCGDFETSGNDYHNTFKIKGLANMWGFTYDLKYLENNNVPMVSFHGDADKLVPYKKGRVLSSAFLINLVHRKVYGSYEIDKRAQQLGIQSVLYTYKKQGHALHLEKDHSFNQNFYDIQYKIRDFFYELMVK